jgi:hypothetical protein
MAWLAACYSYVPVQPGVVPASGDPVALDITDAGRVNLGDRLGPGVTRVEGRLTSADSEYAINVHRVAFISAPASRWSGELVRIDRSLVGSVWQRKLSRGRTAFAAAAITAAVVAVFVTTDLVGFFEGAGGDSGEQPGPISNRVLPNRILRWP